MKPFILCSLACLTLVGCGHAAGAPKKSTQSSAAAEDEEFYAVEIAAEIRRRIDKQKMSISALNVRVFAQGAGVTLRGAVDSEAEKEKIEEIANEIADGMPIESQLTVKGR